MDWFLYDNGLRLERVNSRKKKKQKKTQATRQRLLEISNYNLKYPAISNFNTDNLQNPRFQQCSSKTINDYTSKMFFH